MCRPLTLAALACSSSCALPRALEGAAHVGDAAAANAEHIGTAVQTLGENVEPYAPGVGTAIKVGGGLILAAGVAWKAARVAVAKRKRAADAAPVDELELEAVQR